jgi:hypothetical protein
MSYAAAFHAARRSVAESTRTTPVARRAAAETERTMSWHKRVFAALALAVAVIQPLGAQEKAVGFAVRGGGFNAVTNLNEAGTADFKQPGYSIGGAVTVDLHRCVGVRGDFTYARNELRLNDVDTGSELDRFFYDAGLQLQYPTESGWMPYAFVGAGAVTLRPVGGSDEDETKPAGTVGLGLSYTFPGTSLGIVAEGKGWLYELSELNGPLTTFERTQFEVTWSAGLAYRVPFAR